MSLHPVLSGAPLLIGHRGAAGLAPENTLASFREAVERWAVDMIELDVRASADGHCVVIHDATVDRTTNGSGAVADLTLEALQSLDAGHAFTDEAGGHPFRGQGVRIPTLDEVLTAFPTLPFTVEIKIGTVQAPLLETIRRHDAVDRVVVAGMEAAHRGLFRGYRGAVSATTRELRIFLAFHRLRLAWLWPVRADVFQVPELHPWDGSEETGARRVVTPRFVRDARRKGVPVHVWTVNETDAMDRLLRWGVDGLITDRPDRGARVLAEREGRSLPPGLA
ncbi:MAG: glycerophosphodiester phosphodiesterase [Longimicrobiales bacterium]|nr:glycerophosphodiester phosphodiesterase [Longimicrobiales bacterium]